MLEELVSRKDASEKKRILADEYGMTMTAELERRIQVMCNWSESIIERERRAARKEARIEAEKEARIEAEKEARIEARIEARKEALERMIRVDITKEQILSMGYTEAEYKEAESALYANA